MDGGILQSKRCFTFELKIILEICSGRGYDRSDQTDRDNSGEEAVLRWTMNFFYCSKKESQIRFENHFDTIVFLFIKDLIAQWAIVQRDDVCNHLR